MKLSDMRSGHEFLQQTDQNAKLTRVRQRWDPDSRTLHFGCGDGTRGVVIDSTGNLSNVIEPFPKTRLTRDMVRRLQEGHKSKEGPELVAAVRDILDGYVHFAEPGVSLLIALWVTGTYIYTMFGHYGYLFIYSALKRSGKTRVLEVLQHLAFDATTPLNTPTVPAIREMASDGRAVLLDTLERWHSKSNESFAAAMELFDAGFRNGGTVTKMIWTGDGWRREEYVVYSPYGLAAIGRDSLADTALDRSFLIEMRRKDIRNKKARYEFHRCDAECGPLRLDLYAWALANAERVWHSYHDDAVIDRVNSLGLNDRAGDVWLPIFALANVLNVLEDDQRILDELAVSMGLDPDREEDLQRLAIVRGLVAMCDRDDIVLDTSESLIEKLRCRDIAADRDRFHEVMSLVGVEQTSNRINGEPRRSWRIPQARLVEVERELAALLGPGIATTPTTRPALREPRRPEVAQ